MPAIVSQSDFALGGRGERPILFPCSLEDRKRIASEVPGAVASKSGIHCTWDLAPVVAAELGEPFDMAPPTDQNINLVDVLQRMPGLQRWHDLGLHQKLRDYQKTGALFLARRAYGLNADPMRAGKTRQALAATVLAGYERTLIISPAIAKLVWAEEIAKVLGQTALLLEGRAGTAARWFCVACMGRGRLASPEASLEAAQAADWTPTRIKRLLKKSIESPGYAPCPVCAPKRGPSTGTRVVPSADVRPALEEAQWVIVNYDLLTTQRAKDADGGVYLRKDLPGWSGVLSRYHFDNVIADELHLIRGWRPSSDSKSKGLSRRDRFNQATAHIDVCWGLTGTPIFGFVRDLWGQFDALSKGAVTGNNSRLPFPFHVRYCNGQKGEYGWEADGRSTLAETELPARLDHYMIRRPRSTILKSMPAKIRLVHRVEGGSKARSGDSEDQSAKRRSRGGLTMLLGATLAHKLDTITETIISELAGQQKCIVFTLTKENCRTLADAVDKAILAPPVRTRMREVGAKVWSATGAVSQATRFHMAAAFREHPGSACFVATIDSMQVGISLRSVVPDFPVSTVHFADLHYSPSALVQAEDRPYEPGTNGLTIAYYVLAGSADEHIEEVVLPKAATIATIVAEEGAEGLKTALGGPSEKETLDELYRRLLSGLEGDDDDDEE